MDSPANVLRSHLTGAENSLVADADVESALTRACAGRAPRTRVEVAALLVYVGPASTRVPLLESRPLRRPLLVRLLTGVRTPSPLAAPAFEPCRAPAVRLPQAA